MPVEFVRQDVCENGKCDSTKLVLRYDGSGRRVSKTRLMKSAADSDWLVYHITHYTGIGTEVRELIRRSASPKTTVIVNLPEGLGRYMPDDAVDGFNGVGANQRAGYRPPAKFEWYLKNHLGSTMLVYGTSAYSDPLNSGYKGGMKAAYDYRAFGEQVDLAMPTDKVTENFTGKEKDDETELNYFGARYLDPMLGLWTSVDPARQFSSPYLYAGNGMNPMNVVDPDGNYSLNLNEDNTVARLVQDDDANTVSVFGANGGLLGNYDAPPAESYFFSMTDGQYDIVGKNYDFNMQQNANEMLDAAYSVWPLDAPLWYTGLPLDFKSSYYKNRITVGSLNGTIMTARDVGNALWGGWTRYMYLCGACNDSKSYARARGVMENISDFVAKGKEDQSSAVMQLWGFENFKP